jgi:hypothetical protein
MPVDTTLTPEACNCLAVRSAARHVTQFYDQLLAPTGLRITQPAHEHQVFLLGRT